MKDSGFEAVRGSDPYIEGPIDYANGLRIDNHGLDHMGTKFDVVMAHHVMEHVPNQLEFAQQLFARLSDSGTAIIRLPTSFSWAFEQFRSDRFQLDAPRHLFLHTRTSVERVLREAGFTNLRIRDDSTIWQVLSSRLYRKGVPFDDHLRWCL
jgi:SAM-dependent methyltransferase